MILKLPLKNNTWITLVLFLWYAHYGIIWSIQALWFYEHTILANGL